jgi:hypothetical protein
LSAALTIPGPLLGQCDQLLLADALRSLELSAGTRTEGEWHQAWCSGRLGLATTGEATPLSFGAPRVTIPIALPREAAAEFQTMYQSHFCGREEARTADLGQEGVLQAVASPSAMLAYQQCRAVEVRGLESKFSYDELADAFVVSLRYRPDSNEATRPRLRGISLTPKSSAEACTGPLATAGRATVNLTTNWSSMACAQEGDEQAVVVLLDTDAGSFHRTIATIPRPPTTTQIVLGALPAGIILPWYSQQPVPAGFRLCDGTDGMPDLVDRFPMGTGDPRDIGVESGDASHEHSLAQLRAEPSRSGGGGRPDGWHAAGMSQVGSPQTTGLNHTHGIAGKLGPASSIPPNTRVMFICKT